MLRSVVEDAKAISTRIHLQKKVFQIKCSLLPTRKNAFIAVWVSPVVTTSVVSLLVVNSFW